MKISFPAAFQKKAIIATTFVMTALPLGLTACNGEMPSTASADSANSPESTGKEVSSDSSMLKLALKYVEFTDSDGKPVLTQDQMNSVTQRINELYAPCKIQFVAEQYKPVQPKQVGLEYNTQSMNELEPIRSQFKDANHLVVINTGDWNHDSMGTANAWTAMPGENPAGAVIEANSASFGGIVAHELGHYLGLDHVDDTENMMNPIIYQTSTAIDAQQCDSMRQAVSTYWTASLR